MAKEFDATTRHLIEANPRAWLKFLGISSTAAAIIIDSDISTVTAEADKVIRVEEALPWLVHLEMQANYDATLGLRMARYNVMLEVRHELPVLSVVVLLRRSADGPTMTGLWQRKLPDGFCCHDFRYRIIRAWEQRADETLAGDMAILPLAPLADDAKDRLPQIFEQLGERYEAEPEFSNRQALWASTFALMGLRYTKELVMTLSQDRSILKESSFYQGILEEGEAKGSLREAKKMLRLVGSEKFGEPDSGALATIDQIHEVERIEELVKHVMRTASWQDLLETKH